MFCAISPSQSPHYIMFHIRKKNVIAEIKYIFLLGGGGGKALTVTLSLIKNILASASNPVITILFETYIHSFN